MPIDIHKSRRDLSTLLIHWTRARHDSEPPLSAYAVLQKILSERKLVGGTGYIRGSFPCVCFTEAPIGEIPAFLRLGELLEKGQPKYEPYGIAVPKEWLFERGGRPVIYQSDVEYWLLPSELRWRHCRYEPSQVDFTWEREWRIHTDSLELEPSSTLAITPTSREAFDLMLEVSDEVIDSVDYDGVIEATHPELRWMVVSLELFTGKPVQKKET